MNEAVRTRRHAKLVREGNFVAEVEVTLLQPDDPHSWGPYLTPQDARKLDAVRKALREGNIKAAQELAMRVYALSPVATE